MRLTASRIFQIGLLLLFFFLVYTHLIPRNDEQSLVSGAPKPADPKDQAESQSQTHDHPHPQRPAHPHPQRPTVTQSSAYPKGTANLEEATDTQGAADPQEMTDTENKNDSENTTILQNSKDSQNLTDPGSRSQFIKDAFIYGWRGYKQHAYPHDMLKPLSNTTLDGRSGWGATIVDALTAAILLEVPETIDAALQHIPTISWQIASYEGVAIFGSTIRYLGAMLSAYDMLTTTHSHLVNADSKNKLPELLSQAQALADLLSPSFGTPLGINSNFLNLTDHNITSKNGINDITAISGLPLEWTHLSDLTGNHTYAEISQKSLNAILNVTGDHPSPFPGLFPKHLSLETGNFETGNFDTSDVGGWSHAGGGLYEMLMKNYVYDPVHFKSYREKWITAADSTIKYLASHAQGRPDLTFLAEFNGTELIYRQDHSGMFAAANFILGGAATGEKRFLDFGLQLVNTYIKIYGATETGIGPESFGWIPTTCDTGEETRKEICQVPEEYVSQEKSGFVRSSGYWITNSNYLLRPEVLESLYYAYRVTKDEKYREESWKIVERVIRWCRAGSAFAELEDVNKKMEVGSEEGRRDWMNSYMLSEVLMYSYIIHQEDAPWQLKSNGKNEWVFTTQAHPLRVKAKIEGSAQRSWTNSTSV
ncbi:glycoside hydrolase family 47 protein [Zopfia rhizophila CBS 207.26]|uniref:alpha-1,2-Mannosidase n=1 Tax=Zopfia rhizophila CBS 207.26 TaxID=1314779 RepID=A0A6A6ENN4_9PEZI|nr:glycoside hydrolase family 47 protein [Zopfia rhizophila CBS 207.26]